MKTKIKTVAKEHVLRNANLRLSKEQKRIMKHCSKKISGCPRPEEGSINHFMQYAIVKILKAEFNIDLVKISESYNIMK